MIEIKGVKFYTTEEVAENLGISIQTVRKYIKEERLKAQRVGRSFMISEHSIAKFLNIE